MERDSCGFLPACKSVVAEGIASAVMTRRTDVIGSIAVLGAGARLTVS
jgi:hypothetical protein